MLFLLFLSLLIPPAIGLRTTSLISHLSDSLKLKCDSLPYRTVYIGTRCYFAVSKEATYDDASAQCSSIFPGSEVASNAPGAVFNSMMLDRSKFHFGKDSSGASFMSTGMKQSICVYDTGYKCDVGELSPIISGKCIDLNDQRKDLNKALAYCERQGMEMPAIENELENRMIRSAIGKSPVWIRNAFYYFVREPKWHRTKYYSRYQTCNRPAHPRLWAGWQMQCNIGQSSVVEKSGYWSNTWERDGWANVCFKNAENTFTPWRKPCAALHEWDDETQTCEWKGAKDACVQVIDIRNRTFFVPMPDFPKNTYKEQNFVGTSFNDVIFKAIVREGCMFTGYAAGPTHVGREEEIMDGNLNRGYGSVNVPCYYTGDLGNSADGLSRLTCFCDPTEATLNGHYPSPPPRKKCEEHHVFNETTQQCEWKHDPKYCGELITYDGRRKMIEIPNWPKNRKYDKNHWHVRITEVIVRQHCWATMYWRKLYERKTLEPTGYGRHQVKSHYNGLLGSWDHGTTRVVCECLH